MKKELQNTKVPLGELTCQRKAYTCLMQGSDSAQGRLTQICPTLASKNSEERRKAIQELSSMGKDAIPYLFNALKDDSRGVKDAAVNTIVTIVEENPKGTAREVVGECVKLVKTCEHEIRSLSIDIISRLIKFVAPYLLKYLGDSDRDVRIFISEMLGASEYVEAVSFLEKTLWDQDPNIRNASALSLGNIKVQKAFSPEQVLSLMQ